MATEKRLIDIEEIVKVAEHAYKQWSLAMVGADDTRKINEVFKKKYLCMVVKAVAENCPTVDAMEVVHGRWIPIIDEPTQLRRCAMLSGYKCSVCGRYENEEEPYCNCGAKMDGDGNG